MSDEAIALWQQVLYPLCAALREHTTCEQLDRIAMEMVWDSLTPEAVADVLSTLRLLRSEIEKL
jgi:hypothetical protein